MSSLSQKTLFERVLCCFQAGAALLDRHIAWIYGIALLVYSVATAQVRLSVGIIWIEPALICGLFFFRHISILLKVWKAHAPVLLRNEGISPGDVRQVGSCENTLKYQRGGRWCELQKNMI